VVARIPESKISKPEKTFLDKDNTGKCGKCFGNVHRMGGLGFFPSGKNPSFFLEKLI